MLGAAGREHERDLSFGVVLQLFEEVVALAGPDERAQRLAGAAAAAAPLLDPDAQPPAGDDLGPVLRGLHRLAANLAAERPLVLLVDDVDSCDPASLAFLYLAERMATLPLTLVLACGSAVPRPGPGALDHLVSHPLAAHRRLEALSAAGTAELPAAQAAEKRAREPGPGRTRGHGRQPAPGRTAGGGAPRERLEHFEESPDAVATLAPPATAESLLQRTAVLGSDTAALLQSIAVLGQGAEAASCGGARRGRAGPGRGAARCALRRRVLVQAEKLSFTQPIVGPQRSRTVFRSGAGRSCTYRRPACWRKTRRRPMWWQPS